jgi:hypothetical protein
MPNDPADVLHTLIAEGEVLRDSSSDSESNAQDFEAWIHDVRDVLRELFGDRHGYALDVEEAARGVAHLGRDAELSPARYMRVLTMVTLAILHRAAYELHLLATTRRSAVPRGEPRETSRRELRPGEVIGSHA